MRQVQVDENDLLASLVADAQAGRSVALFREGHPIARAVPFKEEKSRANRMAALAELDSLMEKGYDMGLIWNGRDELYDRDDD